VATIAAVVAIAVSVITSVLTHKFPLQRLELEVSEKWRAKLYELRLEHYPRAFEVTGRLMFSRKSRNSADELDNIKRDLRDWWVGPAALLLSKSSVDAYYNLENALKEAIEIGGMKERTVNLLFKTNRAFRLALRKDLDVIFRVEESNNGLSSGDSAVSV
jgi:hypothetical protein